MAASKAYGHKTAAAVANISGVGKLTKSASESALRYAGNHSNQHGEWDGLSRRQSLHKSDPMYGKPLPGSLSEYRGKQAGINVSREIIELCDTISVLGEEDSESPNTSFGRLFRAYQSISDKVVGILLRARRHGLVHFEGEMLFQRRDDDVTITLIKRPEEMREDIENRIKDLKMHPCAPMKPPAIRKSRTLTAA